MREDEAMLRMREDDNWYRNHGMARAIGQLDDTTII
jgi:hypothetical protein